MNTTKPFLTLMFAALLGSSMQVSAEDIDIYSGLSNTANIPNVMIIVDNSSNSNASMSACTYWDGTVPTADNQGTKSLDNYMCALDSIVHGMSKRSDGSALVKLGITTQAGVYLKLTPVDDNSYTGTFPGAAGLTNRQAIAVAVRAMTTVSGSAAQGESFQETWAYYTGGNGGTTNIGENSGTAYTGTNASTGCQKNYNIFISGVTNSAHSATASSLTNLTNAVNNAAGSNTTLATTLLTPVTGVGSEKPYGIEWARFMSNSDANSTATGIQSIITYSVAAGSQAVYPATMGSWEQYIYDTAHYGGGKYFAATNYAAIQDDILKILNEVQAVNSVFTASSLPVSVNAQGAYLNQIYTGMFRPDPNANPRWLGNLKQYQFILDSSGALQLGDSIGAAALSSAGSGFISPNTVSFWTCGHTGVACSSGTEPTGGFWLNDPGSASAVSLGFDLPDGALAERGGTAQQIRMANLTDDYTTSAGTTSNPRKLYTYCPIGSGCNAALTNSANAFTTANTGVTGLYATFGTASGTATNTLINWMRGEDNQGDEYSLCPPGAAAGTGNCPTPKVTIRPSVHGDVVHSRPTVVNYGGSTGVVVYYGDNGGVFHAVNGNQTAAIGTVGAGSELWGFIPREFFAKLGRQMTNSPPLLMPSTPSGITPTPARKDYFVDGGAGLYQLIDGNGAVLKAYLYLSMRRGGNFIYALDVTDPAAPKFLWKVDSTSPGMSELGQTWSQPKVANLPGHANPSLIFGAGYDTNEDSEPPTADTKGRGIFVLDAITGTLVWSATHSTGATSYSGNPTQASALVSGMDYAIPADITLADRDGDGIVERFYAADMGGNIWRVDLEPTAGNTPDQWRVYKLAALGCATGPCAAGATPRKFLYPPDVIPATATYPFDSVIAGSGDREHPLTINTQTDKLLLVKDTYVGNDATGMTAITQSGLFNATSTGWDGSLNGYYISLASGEKAVNAPLVAAGYAYIGTNQPATASTNSCTANLGIAKGYRLNPYAGTYTVATYSGGGLPPSPVSGVVSIKKTSGEYVRVPFIIGGGGNPGCVGSDCLSGLGGGKPPQTVPANRTRTYWYIDSK